MAACLDFQMAAPMVVPMDEHWAGQMVVDSVEPTVVRKVVVTAGNSAVNWAASTARRSADRRAGAMGLMTVVL